VARAAQIVPTRAAHVLVSISVSGLQVWKPTGNQTQQGTSSNHNYTATAHQLFRGSLVAVVRPGTSTDSSVAAGVITLKVWAEGLQGTTVTITTSSRLSETEEAVK
jgi:hypothetical protein